MRLFRTEKKKNTIFFVIFLSLLVTVFLFSFFLTPGLKGDLEQSIKISLKQPVLFRSIPIHENKIIDYSKKLLIASKDFLSYSDNNFNSFSIDVNFKELEKLKKDRSRALKIRRLINSEEIDGVINYRNKSYKAKIRLKGDLSDHWGNTKQWSLKFKLNKKKTILGMNEFSIIMPENRYFPINFLIEEIFKDRELLNTFYNVVNVKFNGDNWGLMLVEEQYSDFFYSRNKIKEAPIFRFTNEKTEIIGLLNPTEKNFGDMSRWQGRNYISINNSNNIMSKSNIPGIKTNDNLRKIAQSILDVAILNEKKNFPQIKNFLEIDKFAETLAIAYVFGSLHSFADYNVRFYIDPYTLKMEPILRDHGFKYLEKTDRPPNRIYENILFNIPEFKETFYEKIKDIEKNIDLISKKTNKICLQYNQICNQQFKISVIKKNLSYINNNDIFKKTENKKKVKFNTKSKKRIFKKKLYIRAYNDENLEVSNLTSEKIKLKNIFYSKKENCINCKSQIYSFNKNILPSKFEKISNKNYKLDKLNDGYKFIVVEYEDENQNVFFDELELEDYIFRPSFLFSKKDIKTIDEISVIKNEYILKSGNYIFKEPLIIPPGNNLIIKEGTKISMKKNAYIQVENGTVNFLGTKEKPIIFKPLNETEKWKGLYVNSKNFINQTSKMTNVEFHNIDYFNNNLIQLTGAINFINSKIKLKNIGIFGATAEDSLNIVNSIFEIENIKVSNTSSDAIDFDYSDGNLRDGFFKNIEGDGIDTSGSNVQLSNVYFDQINDKAISAGEKSSLFIKDAQIQNSKIGIASKDTSYVSGNNINIKDCIWYDFAAYRKKPYFNGAKLDLKNSSGCNMSIVQKGSLLIYNDEIIKAKKFSVKKMYEGIKQ